MNNPAKVRTLVPRKLVEIAFRRLWILLIPVIAVPLAVVAFRDGATQYRSSAVIWIANPPGGVPALGHYNPYLSPSQNQANALNDLLSSDSFRVAIASEAGLPPLPGGDTPHLAPGSVYAYSGGVNLLVIAANADTPDHARAAVAATISQFNERSAAQVEREAGLTDGYYRQQLAVAERELETRREELNKYLEEHPQAANPNSAASLSLDYQALVARVREQSDVVARLQQSLQDVELKLVAAPKNQEAAFALLDAPEAPVAPVPASMTERFGYPFAGLLFGLFVSGTYLYVVYRTNHTILSSEDLAGLNVPLLGRVPELRNRSRFAAVTDFPWVPWGRHRDFARHTASAISSDAGQQI